MNMKKAFALFVVIVLCITLCKGSRETDIINQKVDFPTFDDIPADQIPAQESLAGPLKVHVVAHTHDDVGWLKTVDEYFYGLNESIQSAGVQYILDTVINELTRDPARKFIYVEMGFFFRWWREQTDATKNIVRNLVKNGQLEFINGGWCMHDEAGTYYEDMIDQMTLGHRFLFAEFGIVPKIGWQIDPFGHSSTNAFINKEIGFDALFFARMDYQDWANRLPQKAIEMQWSMSASLPDRQLLTGMMYGGYCSPGGYMFEYGDDPIADDPFLENYNLNTKAATLVNYLKQQANAVRHNDIMISWGCDFMYQNAHLNFKNIEKLMKYINANPSFNITMFYSTPSLYAEAITQQNVQWPVKSDDFFPYADGPHAYWTGYFTSRPALKGYVRSSNNLLQATTQLYSLSGLNDEVLRGHIFNLQEPMGVLQHHDAVAGTEKQHVADDYAKRLWIGSGYGQNVISSAISKDIGSAKPLAFTYCPLLNESICPATNDLNNKKTIAVVAYNPLSWARVEYVTLPVPVASVSVLDPSGKVVASQVSKAAPYSVTFAVSVGPMAFTTYFVQPSSSEETVFVAARPLADPISLSNKFITLNLDAQGNFISYTNKVSGKTVAIQQQYLYYKSSTGTPSDGQASGAYIFRPANNTPTPFSAATPVVTYTNATLMSEVRRVFSSSLTQIIRLYADQTYVEVIDIVGPIDTSDNVGKEVITKYTTDLATQDTFYTDSNGIEFQTRKINYRPSWPYQVVEAVSGNYYPINSAAYIKDTTKNAQFTLLTDRSRGGGSVAAGQLETMIQRATVADDSRGVGEPINEHNQIYSVSWLIVDAATTSASNYRVASKRVAHPLILSFATADSATSWKSQFKTDFAPVPKSLPANVHVLTFAPTERASEYILRVQHTFQVGEDATLSQPVTVDINSLLSGYQISSAVETQLTAVRKSTRSGAIDYKGTTRAPINVTLNPTEIRTFIITLQPASKAISINA